MLMRVPSFPKSPLSLGHDNRRKGEVRDKGLLGGGRSFTEHSPFYTWCIDTVTLYAKNDVPKTPSYVNPPKIHSTTLTIPISACYYLKLRSAIMSYP